MIIMIRIRAARSTDTTANKITVDTAPQLHNSAVHTFMGDPAGKNDSGASHSNEALPT
jgi:hypothetical protein